MPATRRSIARIPWSGRRPLDHGDADPAVGIEQLEDDYLTGPRADGRWDVGERQTRRRCAAGRAAKRGWNRYGVRRGRRSAPSNTAPEATSTDRLLNASIIRPSLEAAKSMAASMRRQRPPEHRVAAPTVVEAAPMRAATAACARRPRRIGRGGAGSRDPSNCHGLQPKLDEIDLILHLDLLRMDVHRVASGDGGDRRLASSVASSRTRRSCDLPNAPPPRERRSWRGRGSRCRA